MDGINVGGGAGGFDAYLNLQPPGQERGGFANMGANAKGVTPTGEGGKEATATLAGHFGYSEKDTIGTKLDDVVQFAQQLNISLVLGTGSSESIVQVYLNNLNPTTPTLPPIKFLLDISNGRLEKGDIAGAQVTKTSDANDAHKSSSLKGTGDESGSSGTAGNQGQGFNLNNDSATFEAGSLAANQGKGQGGQTNSGGDQSSGGRTVNTTGSAQENSPYVHEDRTTVGGTPAPGAPVIPNAITNKQLADESTNNYVTQLSESSMQAANTPKDAFSFNAKGVTSDNTETPPQSILPDAQQVNPATTDTPHAGKRAADDKTVEAKGNAKEPNPKDAVHAKGQTVETNTKEGPGTTQHSTSESKANQHFFNTKEGKGDSGGNSGNDTGGSGNPSSGQQFGGGQSGNQSGQRADGDISLGGVLDAHAQVMDGLNSSLDSDISALSSGNAADLATVTITHPTGGNPWLAGSPFVEFQLVFSQLQRILMQNDVVQGRVELAGMKMTVDLAAQTRDAIMAIAQMNMAIHIAGAVMSAASLGMTGVGLAGGMAAGKAAARAAKDPTQKSTAMGLNVNQWSALGGMGSGIEKLSNSVVSAMTDTMIAQKEGLKEMLQAYRTIAQHIMDKATDAFKNNEDMISQLLQTKDKMVDSTQQAVSAALRK